MSSYDLVAHRRWAVEQAINMRTAGLATDDVLTLAADIERYVLKGVSKDEDHPAA